MTHSLAFFRDTLQPGATLACASACARVLYLRTGMLAVRAAGTVAALAPNAAWHGMIACEAGAGKDGAEVYRWELHRGPAPANALLAAGIALSATQGWLMRCDRVDFPPGGIAYTHTHQGPGIRCLLNGELRVTTQGHEQRVAPGEPWFESGIDPVLAHASESVPSAFARVMILPVALRGKSSIRYVLPEDQDKPKRQTYQMFIDDRIEVG